MVTAQAPEKTSSAATWPYTSFKTLLNVLGRFKGAIPPRIDRTALGGSEGQKTQVLGTLRFFGLIGEAGEVTPQFAELINNEKDRPRLIRELLERHYVEANQLGGINGTTGQLAETFKGVTGDTQRKAMTFYLHAAKYANLPTSKNFKVPSGFNRANGQRRSRNAVEREDESSAPFTPPSPESEEKAQKTRYVAMLMEMAKATENGTPNDALLNRIERLLGYGQEEDGSGEQ